MSYYYRENYDYEQYKTAEYLPDYHPVNNPEAYIFVTSYKFLNKDPLFLQSVLQLGDVTAGRMADGFYEVVSADPSFRTGDTVEVFIRDKRHWATSEYMRFTFDVVGETSRGKGLYFSERLCRMMNNSVLNLIYNGKQEYFYGDKLGKNPVAPYEAERFEQYLVDVSMLKFPEEATVDPPPNLKPTPTPEPTPEPTPPAKLKTNEYIYPYVDNVREKKMQGALLILDIGNTLNTGLTVGGVEEYELYCAWLYESKQPRLLLVNPYTFDRMTGNMGSNQISVTMTDYAYTDRVIDEMASLGFLAVSPYRNGSTKLDEKFETERIKLLRVSLAAAVLTLALQIILLKVTFGSLKDQYKLLSNMGLRARTAYGSLAILFAVLTILSELIGAAVILVLNHYGYARVVNIFKYLETPKLILIFAVHFVFCVISYFIAAHSLKKQVFEISGCHEDMDGELMEEVMGE